LREYLPFQGIKVIGKLDEPHVARRRRPEKRGRDVFRTLAGACAEPVS